MKTYMIECHSRHACQCNNSNVQDSLQTTIGRTKLFLGAIFCFCFQKWDMTLDLECFFFTLHRWHEEKYCIVLTISPNLQLILLFGTQLLHYYKFFQKKLKKQELMQKTWCFQNNLFSQFSLYRVALLLLLLFFRLNSVRSSNYQLTMVRFFS